MSGLNGIRCFSFWWQRKEGILNTTSGVVCYPTLDGTTSTIRGECKVLTGTAHEARVQLLFSSWVGFLTKAMMSCGKHEDSSDSGTESWEVFNEKNWETIFWQKGHLNKFVHEIWKFVETNLVELDVDDVQLKPHAQLKSHNFSQNSSYNGR